MVLVYLVVDKRSLSETTPDEVPARTMNQVVVYNVKRARLARGWTLEAAAAALEPHTGGRWSRQNLNALEQSAGPGNVREFNADQVLAFARAFDLPFVWFFIPPEHFDRIATGPADMSPRDVLDYLFVRGWEHIRERLRELPETSFPADLIALIARADLYLLEALSDGPELERQLRQLADNLAWARTHATIRVKEEERVASGDSELLDALIDDADRVVLPTEKTRA